MNVFIAWGHMGEDFTLYDGYDGALKAVKAEAERLGYDPGEVDGRAGGTDGLVDGLYVEACPVHTA